MNPDLQEKIIVIFNTILVDIRDKLEGTGVLFDNDPTLIKITALRDEIKQESTLFGQELNFKQADEIYTILYGSANHLSEDNRERWWTIVERKISKVLEINHTEVQDDASLDEGQVIPFPELSRKKA